MHDHRRYREYRPHTVKRHDWHDGMLTTIRHLFDSLADAMLFANLLVAQTIKVYDADNEVIFTKVTVIIKDTNTYA